MADRDETDSATDVAHFSDRELVAACLENDPRAWEALISRYQRLIYSIPVKQGFSSVDAADVFHSVCLILRRRLPSLRDHDKLFSWLMTTTTRECYRVAARWQREGTVGRRTASRPPSSDFRSAWPCAPSMTSLPSSPCASRPGTGTIAP